jgi:phosphoribosylanthranilate isomerase
MKQTVKICGLSDAATLEAAISAGADMVGFVFFARSLRHISLQTARMLGERARGRSKIVALTVDADDRALDDIFDALTPDIVQLHGQETPERVSAIGRIYGRPTMKAIGVAAPEDFVAAQRYAGAADFLLIDAKPPKAAILPGGNGVSFDWALARGFAFSRPWLLSGGLDPENVERAVAESGAAGVDVSSGIERAPGEKDPDRIRAFVAAARRAFSRATEGVG